MSIDLVKRYTTKFELDILLPWSRSSALVSIENQSTKPRLTRLKYRIFIILKLIL